ncbi:MAG TPA: class I SAM-dependent methyltransferase [Thermoanaerobaculia bacterium]|nr:class I SAM-dependent methyltransferase [Thermoanaerobaculia bacterium]
MDNTEYFDAVAGQWDNMRSRLFTDEVRESALRIADVQAGRTATDIGAGTGFLTEGLLRRGLNVIAVDHSSEMLGQVQRKFAESGRLQARQGESEQLPIGDGAVDHVFANMYLHHVESPGGAIREMVRILKPSGTIVVTDLDEHTHEFLRVEHHDRWLGFKHDDIRRWFLEAGLHDIAVLGIAQECRVKSDSGCETAAISIFAASGRKWGGEP